MLASGASGVPEVTAVTQELLNPPPLTALAAVRAWFPHRHRGGHCPHGYVGDDHGDRRRGARAKTATPVGAGNVLRSMTRNRSREIATPLVLCHVVRKSTVPKVELLPDPTSCREVIKWRVVRRAGARPLIRELRLAAEPDRPRNRRRLGLGL